MENWWKLAFSYCQIPSLSGLLLDAKSSEQGFSVSGKTHSKTTSGHNLDRCWLEHLSSIIRPAYIHPHSLNLHMLGPNLHMLGQWWLMWCWHSDWLAVFTLKLERNMLSDCWKKFILTGLSGVSWSLLVVLMVLLLNRYCVGLWKTLQRWYHSQRTRKNR